MPDQENIHPSRRPFKALHMSSAGAEPPGTGGSGGHRPFLPEPLIRPAQDGEFGEEPDTVAAVEEAITDQFLP